MSSLDIAHLGPPPILNTKLQNGNQNDQKIITTTTTTTTTTKKDIIRNTSTSTLSSSSASIHSIKSNKKDDDSPTSSIATTSTSSTSNNPTNHSTPSSEIEKSNVNIINPLYSLGERVEDGEIAPVHVYRVQSGDVEIKQGEESIRLLDPTTWHFSHSSTLKFDSDKNGEGSQTIQGFRDEGMEQSARDGLRMAARDLRNEVHADKEAILVGVSGKGKEKEVIVDPSVTRQLATILIPPPRRRSTSSRDSISSRTGEPSPIRGASPSTTSSSYFPSSYSSMDPSMVLQSSPPRVSSLVSSAPPVLNAPGFVITNSRTTPIMTESPTRLVTTASLTKTLPSLIGTTSLLFPPPSPASPNSLSPNSNTIPPIRRSNSIAASPSSSSSLYPINSRSSKRAQSFSTQSHIDSSQSNVGGLQYTSSPSMVLTQEPLELDSVESSIAAQASLIRKERQTKRLEKEKELEEEAKADLSRGMPLMKRRSTKVDLPGAGVLVGNLIGQDHANYVLMYNMLTGIRIAVSRCQAKLERPVTDQDYTARHKFSFDIVGNELTPSTKYDFKFKDYAPWVFRELRTYFGLDPSDYLISLTAKYILSELGSPGKSGSFFYFSRDYRFIIKTIRHSEHKFLRSILKEYHEYIKLNPHTLLSRFYGLHRVKLPRGRKIHFVIMNNLFPPHRDIHETYDLKGSSAGRIYPEEKALNNPTAILKDLNWIGRNRHLALGPEKKALFEEQLRRDTQLMQKLGIMDYSLLTGIHNLVRGNVDNLRDGMLTVFQPDTVKMRRKPTQVKRDADASALRKAVQRSDPKPLEEANKLPEQDTEEKRRFLFYQDDGGIRATGDNNEELGVIYYLGIIDILTPYTLIKKLEHFFRSMKHDGRMISAVPPHDYGERFLAFIKSVIVGNDESLRPPMWSPPVDNSYPHQPQASTSAAIIEVEPKAKLE